MSRQNESKTKRILRAVFWTVVTLAVLAAGFVGRKKMIEARPEVKKVPSWTKPVPVEVAEVTRTDHRVIVRATGTVLAAAELTVQPEVTGRLEAIHPELKVGGLVAKDERLVQIEERDYSLSIRSRKAEIAAAKLEIKTEKSRKNVAEREWELLGADIDSNPNGKALSLREPQLVAAKARLAAAKSELDRARLQLERTEVFAPFNAMVLAESVEVGQLVTPQMQVARLIGTDEFWVEVDVPLDELKWIPLPGPDGTNGATARVYVDGTDGPVVEREGRIVRLLADLDPRSRMARLLVSVSDPLLLADGADKGGLPLLLNSYVRVEIQGRTLEDVVPLEPIAVRDGNRVYVAADARVRFAEPVGAVAADPWAAATIRFGIRDKEGQHTLAVPAYMARQLSPNWELELASLEIRSVEIAHRDQSAILVAKGLDDDERIIPERVARAVEGMTVRIDNRSGEALSQAKTPGEVDAPGPGSSDEPAEEVTP